MEFLKSFKNLKPKTKNIERYYEYLTLILNSFINGFKLDIDNTLETEVFWTMLINEGKIGCTMGGDGKPHIGLLKYKTGLDENGKMTPNGIICLNGTNYDGETKIIKMFYTDEPIMLFSRFADRLAEVDLSQEVLVHTSRYGQVIPVGSETEKKRLEKAYSNVDNGILQTYVLDFNINGSDKKPVELFDVNKFQSMEYLSSYHAELLRRLYGLWGFACQGKNKQAQVTEDELDGQRGPSILMPLTVLENVKKSFDDINNAFGTNFSINASDLLQRQITDIIEDETEKELKEGVENETETVTE